MNLKNSTQTRSKTTQIARIETGRKTETNCREVKINQRTGLILTYNNMGISQKDIKQEKFWKSKIFQYKKEKEKKRKLVIVFVEEEKRNNSDWYGRWDQDLWDKNKAYNEKR